MTWVLGRNERQSIVCLPARERFSYSIKRIADWKLIWTLRNNDGFALLGAGAERECVPIWPHADFASMFARGPWPDHVSVAIDLDAWLDRWTPGMVRDRRLAAVFPVSLGGVHDDAGLCSPHAFAAALRDELDLLP